MRAANMQTPGDYLKFLRRRFTRIAPPFYVALALFAALSFTSFGIPSLLGRTPSLAVQMDDLMRDAVFMPTTKPMHDMPMWTLGIEMRWYVVFPFVLLLFYRSKTLFLLTLPLVLFLYSAGGPSDLAYLPAFMLGIFASVFLTGKRKANALWTVLAIGAFVVAVAEQRRMSAIDHGSVLWDVACFALVLAVTTNAWLKRAFSSRPLVQIGIASYSIYLVHQPFLEALVWSGASPFLAALVGLAIGGTFWYFVERPLCSHACRTTMESQMIRAYHAITFGRLRIADPLPSRSTT